MQDVRFEHEGETWKLSDLAPQRTVETANKLVDSFRGDLANRAVDHMKRRGSKTATETDVIMAYRELTVPPSASRFRRYTGDFCMTLGGACLMTPLSSPAVFAAWVAAVAGGVLIAVGIMIREAIE